jgi:hypothetical protein
MSMKKRICEASTKGLPQILTGRPQVGRFQVVRRTQATAARASDD